MGEPSFYGKFTLTIDDKGRLTVPSSFRKGLGEEIFLRIDRQRGCLEILPPSTWNSFQEGFKRIGSMDPKALRLRAFEMANVIQTNIDRQGRVLIPAEMKEWAGITGTAVVTGDIDRVLVWSPECWQALGQTVLAEEKELIAYVKQEYQI
ncbi:MAG TPA: division/cell wall cluster transcriptional repressor MraZ [Candidatus Nitrosotenuis sp.]|nr:division/cell wall cluster transcriptional repressor MraZ [Candidatus Nitrosotenuis sp.]